MPEPLTREDRERAIERALQYERGWPAEQVRRATTIDEAVALVRVHLAWFGYRGREIHVTSKGAETEGLRVDVPGTNRAGWITWREIAEYVRQPRQLGLPV